MKHGTEEAIYAKIDELMAFRRLTLLLSLAEPPVSGEWVDRLKRLQYSIYQLDAYLESDWKLDKSARRERWAAIGQALCDLGYTQKQSHRLLHEIREYERIELACRKNRWPTTVPFTRFYRIKSCDVRLMRTLLYKQAPLLNNAWPERTWRYFDQITEVQDDIADLQEDLPTWNANRFLVSLLRKGIPHTATRYHKALRRIGRKAARYFDALPADSPARQVGQVTQTQLAETTQLLATTLDRLDPAILSESWLLRKMS